MAEKERRLGKGLDSLISAAREKSLTSEVAGRLGHRVQPVAVESISPNPFQPRKEFSIEALNQLIESLREHGLLQPIVVRRSEDGFDLIAGERRWRAARELGWPEIDAVVVKADDRRMLEWSIIENVQRRELGPLELAGAYQRMMTELKMTQEEVARRIGQSRSNVANILRLLELPAVAKDAVSRGTLSMGAARALLAVSDPDQVKALVARIQKDQLSVRQVEALARKVRKSPATGGRRRDPNLEALAKELEGEFGVKTAIQGSLKRGKVVFDYYTQAELDRFVRRLRGEAPAFDEPDDLASDSITV